MNYLSPLFNEQTFDDNGDPLVGGQIYTYIAGTSTPLATYTTQNGVVQHANPIILDARGEPANPIWLGAGQEYKFSLFDSNNNLIRTIDDVSGINDTSLDQSEWQVSTLTPTYISATSFSLTGDQTLVFAVGRRLRTTNTGGTVYSTISTSTFGAGITTIVVRNDSGVLDSGLSAVAYGVLAPTNSSIPNSQDVRQTMGLGYGADIASAATVNLATRTGKIVRITGTVQTTAVTMVDGDEVIAVAVGAWPINISGVLTYTCSAGDSVLFWQDDSGTQSALVIGNDGVTPVGAGGTGANTANGARANLIQLPTVRQTVLSGPVDSSGLPNFGGSTGTTTVTASGTLVSTASNGISGDRIGSITNPAWTGLSTNGTMYLYLEIALNGTCTTGSTTLAPNYQWGGTYSTTNGQHTFNIQEMQMQVGNGASASQTYRVFVGEVTVAGNVVTAIVWYALMGRYDSGYTNTLPSSATQVSRNHNIGLVPEKSQVLFRNITPELNYSAGDVIINPWITTATAGQFAQVLPMLQRLNVAIRTPGSAWTAVDKTTGTAAAALTAGNWAYKITAERGW